jgi:hypothetical protein
LIENVTGFPRTTGWPVDSRWIVAGAALMLFTGAATLLAFEPGESGLFPPCPFHAISGLYCPGCGTLRGLHQLLNGNLLKAIGFNPLMALSLPFVGYALHSNTVSGLSRRRLPGVFIPAAWIWMLLGVIVLFWVLRNVPAYPFTVLAP